MLGKSQAHTLNRQQRRALDKTQRPREIAAVHYNRGNALQNAHRLKDALKSYDRAIDLDPSLTFAHNNRGNVFRKLGQMDKAIACYSEAIALNPDYAIAHNNRGDVLRMLRRFDEALVCFQRAQQIAPDFAGAHQNEYLLSLLVGNFGHGWRKMECRWGSSTFDSPMRNFPQPLWLGDSSLAGKTILLHSEQGFGDTIQFCRYIPMVAARGARVLLEVEEPLLKLLVGIPGLQEIIPKGGRLPEFDVHCPLMSLPLAFDTRLDTIPSATPYLSAPADAPRDWTAAIGSKCRPRIGLAWSGNPNQGNDERRSLALSEMKGLLDLDATFVSLQKEIRHTDRVPLAQSDILNLGESLEDFADTAALISELDLVITVDTSVAHLAGALGKPVWLLLAYIPDWRWLLDRDDSPWYPTARLFRQTESRAWGGVFARVREALVTFVPSEAA